MDKPVVDHHIRPAQQGGATNGDEARVARPRSHQIYSTCCHDSCLGIWEYGSGGCSKTPALHYSITPASTPCRVSSSGRPYRESPSCSASRDSLYAAAPN